MIFESAWEVCNKIGGIYTVLCSRAGVMMSHHRGDVCFIGPLRSGDLPDDFMPDSPPAFTRERQARIRKASGLHFVVGRWRVPGHPPVILIGYPGLYPERDAIYYELWERYGIRSEKADKEYENMVLFGVAAAKLIEAITTVMPSSSHLALFNEWQTAAGLLYAHKHDPELRTVFLTHATTVGRSIASNNKDLYTYLPGYDGDRMAMELGVELKHALEKHAALSANVFATVSEVTAREAEQIIGRRPTVLPNGFVPDFVPGNGVFARKREAARAKLIAAASILNGREYPADSLIVSISGRYEYRNKGIDLYLDALAGLSDHLRRGKELQVRPIIAYLFIPADVAMPRADLAYLLDRPFDPDLLPLQQPYVTHLLHNAEHDAISNRLNAGQWPAEYIAPVFVPAFLDGHDGIFNLSYYDLLIGTDFNIYPSYYEPWGYTPLESVAFGIPTLTTDLAGFGRYLKQHPHRQSEPDDIFVLDRNTAPADKPAAEIAAAILLEASRNDSAAEIELRRRRIRRVAADCDWQHFYARYLEAYNEALQ